MPLSEAGASFAKTISNLGGDPENPFVIFPEVKEAYEKMLDEKRKAGSSEERLSRLAWEKENPELAEKLQKLPGRKAS